MKGLFPRGLRPLVILAVLTVFAASPALGVDGEEEPNVAAKAQAAGVGTDQDDPLAAVISDLESNKGKAPAGTPVAAAPERRSRNEDPRPAAPQVVGELPADGASVVKERGTIIPYIPNVPPGEKPARHPHRAWQAPSRDPAKYEEPAGARRDMDVSYPPEYQPRLYQDPSHIPSGVEAPPSYTRPAYVPPAPVTAPAPMPEPVFEAPAPVPAPMAAPRAPERRSRGEDPRAADPQVLREIPLDGSAPTRGSHPVVPYLPAPVERTPVFAPPAPVMEAPAPAPVAPPAPVAAPAQQPANDPSYSMPATRPSFKQADPEPVMVPEQPAPAPRVAPPARQQAPAGSSGDLYLDGPVTDIPTHSGPPATTHSAPVHEPGAAPEDTMGPASAGPSFIPPPQRQPVPSGPRQGVTPLEDERMHPPAGVLDFSSPEGVTLQPDGGTAQSPSSPSDGANPDDALMPLQLQPYNVTGPQLIPSQSHGQAQPAMPPQGYQTRQPALPHDQGLPQAAPPAYGVQGTAPAYTPPAYGHTAGGNIIAMVNSARAMGSMCGSITMPQAPPLHESKALSALAAQHAADMAQRNYFSSTTPEGATLGSRLSAAGYNWAHFASNIAAKSSSAQQTLNLWMQKPTQCSNLMGAEFTEAGYATDPTGRYSVLILATPMDPGAIRLQ